MTRDLLWCQGPVEEASPGHDGGIVTVLPAIDAVDAADSVSQVSLVHGDRLRVAVEAAEDVLSSCTGQSGARMAMQGLKVSQGHRSQSKCGCRCRVRAPAIMGRGAEEGEVATWAGGRGVPV